MFPPLFINSLRMRPNGRTTEMPGRAAAPLRARDHAPIHPADLNQQPAVVAPPFAVAEKIVALTGRRCRPVELPPSVVGGPATPPALTPLAQG